MTRATLLATTTAILLPVTGALAQSVETDTGTSVATNGNDAVANATVEGAGSTDTTMPAANDTTEGSAEADADAQTDLTAQSGATTVGEITGKDVVDASGEVIGSVEMVVEQSGGKAAVIGVGGFLGIGAHDVSIPASDLGLDADGRVVLSGHTEEDLRERPAFNSSDAVALSADVELPELG